MRGDKEVEQLCANVEYIWGMEKFLRIKTPRWRLEGVLEEQASLMEDIDGYFRKWRE